MQNFDLTILWSRKWTVLFLTLTAVLCGAAYTLTASPVYQSEAKLLVVRRHSSTELRKAADERYFLATQAEIMGSAKILTAALEKLGRSIDQPVDELLENVKVSPMDDTDVMSVTVRDAVPEQADELVGAIVETYADYVRTVDEERSSESVAAIVRREKELSEELVQARAEHVRLRAESPLVGLDGDGIKIQMVQLQQLATELATATNLRIDLD
ncbi:MAG: Wzz/FepE/Etk N-terminal domain-containing protein, partial [Planctomycetaceae bacterium]